MDDEADFLSITPLGSGNEVGRSCHILQFKGKTIMLDCGIHPAGKGIDALPYFDQVDAHQIDIILISHFHLDHAAALPYFLAQTNFRGRVFMTHPTKSIYKLILQDFVKVSAISADTALYDEDDLINSMDKIEAINFHQVVHYKGIKFWCYHAGHVLGAAMFMIEIAGVKVLYTGDYSRREDRHLMAAEIPPVRPDVLIVESTWGIRTIPPISEREKRFTDLVHQVLVRGGRVLIPVFALGRAQELLLILDEYWDANPSLHSYPIYYASALAKKCMTVYKRYVNMMNNAIRSRSELGNPFNFRHILNLKGIEQLDDIGPSIVMASPGMLQNGLSRQLFEMWCSDKRNAVVLAGYSVEGTLAKQIQNEPDHITTLSGLKIPLNMSVHEVSFSAHADFSETSEFIALLRPRHIVLVHGESNQMLRLRQELLHIYDDGSISVIAPKNCQQVELEFKSERIAKVVGSLAARAPYLLSGLVVRRDFADRIMAVEDLPVESALSHTIITQNVKIPFRGDMAIVEEFLSRVYALGKETVKDEVQLVVMADVRVALGRDSDNNVTHVSLEWCSNPVTDMIADSVMCILLSIESNVASAKILSVPCDHGHACKSELDRGEDDALPTDSSEVQSTTVSQDHRHVQMQSLLRNVFESANLDTEPYPNIAVSVSDRSARVFLEQFDVFAGDDEDLRQAVEQIASRGHAAIYPIAAVTTVDELMEDYHSGKQQQQQLHPLQIKLDSTFVSDSEGEADDLIQS